MAGFQALLANRSHIFTVGIVHLNRKPTGIGDVHAALLIHREICWLKQFGFFVRGIARHGEQ